MKKGLFVLIIISALIITICYNWWFSPICILCGGVLLAVSVIGIVMSLFKELKEDDYSFGGCLSFLIIGVLLAVNSLWGKNYYISQFRDSRHLYEDCKQMNGPRKEKVHKISAFVWGCFDECEFCKKRKTEELKKKRIEYLKQKKANDLEFIDAQIEELKEVRQRIIDDEDIDTNDYRFRYDVEDEIWEEAAEEIRNGEYEYEPRGRI